MALRSAINATNEISMAPTFIARWRPSDVPRPAASMMLPTVCANFSSANCLNDRFTAMWIGSTPRASIARMSSQAWWITQ